MAFAVVVGHGHSKLIVRFPTAAEALAEARKQIEEDQTEVVIRESATSTEFTVNAFAEKIRSGGDAAANVASAQSGRS